MRYRRRLQQFEPQEESFARKFKFEALKENLGKLVEYGGMGIGALAGTVAAKTGLPLSPTAVTIIGAAIGGFAASTGKASVVSAVDHFLERRDRRQDQHEGRRVRTAAPAGDASYAPSRQPLPIGQLWRRAATARDNAKRSGGRDQSAGVGSLIGAIGASISQFERQEGELAGVMQQMRISQDRLMALLRGGRHEMTSRQLLTAAQENVKDTANLIHQAGQDLKAYLRTL